MDFNSARINMVDCQVKTNDVTDLAIQDAMRLVARERFCAPARAFSAYAEVEAEICPGRWLMRPRDISKLLQVSKPKVGQRALGLAAPYAAAVLATIGLEVTAQEGDARAGAVLEQALDDYGVALVIADLATPTGSDWDLIVCEAAVTQAPPAWIAALKVGGHLALVERDGPVGKARLFQKLASGSTSREVFDATPPMLAGFERAPTFQF